MLLNNGQTKRDYTYIDDTVLGIEECLIFGNFTKNYHEVFNIGTGNAYTISYLTKILGSILNIKYKTYYKKHHPTDMRFTNADIKKSKKLLNYEPKISLENGLKYFLNWYLQYEKIKK